MSRVAQVTARIMRAIRVHEFGAADKMVCEKNVPVPAPGENEVLIKVSAAGVNPVDTYIRSGAYAALPPLPYTPGQDAAGVVTQVGSKVNRFKEGDRVFTVRTTSGAYAEYTAAEEKYVTHLSDGLSFAQGASMGVPYYTAYRALMMKAEAKPGETVLIHGASGAVGIAATQIAKANGLRVVGTAGTKEGLELVKAQGADVVLNHREEGYTEGIQKATAGQGVHIVLEMLANVNLQTDLTLMAYGGRIIVIGCRGPVEIHPRLTMGKELTIKGVMLMGTSDADWTVMRAALERGQRQDWVRPQVARTYPLEQSPQAHHDVIHNSGTLGKLVLDLEAK